MTAATPTRRSSPGTRLGVLFTIFVGTWFAAWKLTRPEPVYGNQPLSYWMERMSDPATAGHASGVLTEMGPEAMPALVDALNTRTTPMSELGHGLAVRLSLAEARSYDAPNIRATAAYLLGQMRKDAAPAAPNLIEALGDEDAVVRMKAIRALTQIGEPAMGDLTAALTNREPMVRFGAVKALGSLGPRAKSAAPALADRLQDSQQNVREAAAMALVAVKK